MQKLCGFSNSQIFLVAKASGLKEGLSFNFEQKLNNRVPISMSWCSFSKNIWLRRGVGVGRTGWGGEGGYSELERMFRAFFKRKLLGRIMSFKPFNKTTQKILAKYKSSRNDNRAKCILLKRKCKTLILPFKFLLTFQAVVIHT